MAENEFEKNVRREMDEFRVHPSEEVWSSIEKRIRENKRRRRIVFFVLFSLITLMVGGYAIYNFSGDKTKPQAENNLSETIRSNDGNKIENKKTGGHNQETVTIKPTIPAEKAKKTNIRLVVAGQKGVSQPGKKNKPALSVLKETPASGKQATVNADRDGKKNDQSKNYNTNQQTTSVPTVEAQANHPNQNEIPRAEDKNLTRTDATGLKVEESKDTRSIEVVKKKKGEKVSGKIIWGVNLSAGSSVITEEAFSFKSSTAAADRQYSAPGSSPGGNPATGGGGPGGGTYYTYGQSENKAAFAFKAGVIARKNISKRSSLSAGLTYSYLADKIMIGTNQTPSQSFSALWYYSGSPKQTYTDHFHFIEIPLIYNLRVTNNEDHFLSINAGVAPSYLVATNALIYDTTMGGIYYHNKDLITKAHFNFISGVAYQFKNKKDLVFSVGPQFSFDVTKAFKSDLDKRKYFLYTGIDARVFFDRKKK